MRKGIALELQEACNDVFRNLTSLFLLVSSDVRVSTYQKVSAGELSIMHRSLQTAARVALAGYKRGAGTRANSQLPKGALSF